MKPTTSRARLRAGFSLIELLGVCIILGMLATVVVVSWQALLPGTRLNAAVRNLSERLAGARSEAIARNATFEIYYDLDLERYWVRTPYRIGGGKATAYQDEERAIMDLTNLDEAGVALHSVKIDGELYRDGQVFVRFDPLGASSAHTIVLYQEIFDSYFTLEVLPLTGEIRFHEGVYEREEPREGAFD